MKKIFAILMVLATLVGILGMTGCSNNYSAEANFVVPETGFDPNEKVTITFEHTMGQAPIKVLEAAIERFNKLYPNIEVKQANKGGWTDIAGVINKEIMANNQPNIVYCYPDHVATYNLSKSVITLDNLIASDFEITRADGSKEILGLTQEQIDDFVKAYYEEGQVYGDGLMYTMPLAKSTEVLYYNKDAFEEWGIKVPTTWDEMWEACRILKEKDPNCVPLGYDSADNWFITYCEQAGYAYTSATGEHFLFDNDETRAFIEELRGYYKLGYFTTKQMYTTYTSGLFTEDDPDQSRCYMCIGSTGGAAHQIPTTKDEDGNETIMFEVGVADMPQVDVNNKKAISQGPSVCILKGKDTTDQQIMASWLFVKFLCTDVEFQRVFTSSQGYMPVINSITEDETFAAWLDEGNGFENLTALVIKTAMEGRENYFTSPAFAGSTAARTEVGELLNKCISDQITSDLTQEQVKKLIKDAFADSVAECKYQVG